MSYVPAGSSDYKKSVRVATTANISLSSPGSSIDGVTLNAGDRVLVKDQTTGANNGVYVFDTSSTEMIRATDADSGSELSSGVLIPVEEGSTYADTLWMVATDGVIIVGTTSISFEQIASSGGSVAALDVSYAGSSGLSASNVEAALDELDSEKAAATHSHAISDVTSLQTTLDGKASSSHNHIVSDVTGLQSALDTKLNASLLPVGMISQYAGSTAPTGWLLCAGQSVSRTTYADLFAAIGTTFGSGDGSTTFGIPDLRGRTPVGLDNLGGSDAGRLDVANTLGGSGGSQKVTLTGANMPSHDHGGSLTTGGGKADFNSSVSTEGEKANFTSAASASSNTHSHNFTYNTTSNTTTSGTAQRVTNITTSSGSNTVGSQGDTHDHTVSAANLNSAQSNHSHTITAANLDAAQADHTHPVTIASAYGNGSGGTDAHDNMQPYLLLGYIIKT